MHRRTSFWVALAVGVLFGGIGAAAWAAAAPEAPAANGAAAETAGRSLFDLINAGGALGYFTIFTGVLGVALSIEHFMTIRRAAILPPAVLVDVEECFDKEEYEQAIAVCEQHPTFFTNIIAAGLARINAGYKQMEEAMNEAGEEGAIHLQHKISYIALIANLGPMLGLLGTVQGIILALGEIAQSTGAPSTTKLADNISLGLVCTFEGLSVAIPMMAIHHFLKNRVQKMVLEVNVIVNELMARFRPVE